MRRGQKMLFALLISNQMLNRCHSQNSISFTCRTHYYEPSAFVYKYLTICHSVWQKTHLHIISYNIIFKVHLLKYLCFTTTADGAFTGFSFAILPFVWKKQHVQNGYFLQYSIKVSVTVGKSLDKGE